MKCPKCQAEQAADARFCSQCAEPLTVKEPPKESVMPVWTVILIVLCMAVIGLLALVITRQSELPPATSIVPVAGSYPQPQSPAFVPQISPLSQPYTQPIVNSAVTIKARSILWYTIVIPPNVTKPVVNAHFAASGGSGNDIIIYVVNSDGLANLSNNRAAATFFNSGRVTEQDFSVFLPSAPGIYYLVLDNRFSIITPKAVQINATLSYVR